MWASYEGHTATVQALIGAGADVNFKDKVWMGCVDQCTKVDVCSFVWSQATFRM
jgi:hypothetical protein